MTTQQNIQIRIATPQEDSIIAKHFYQLWRDNDVPTHFIKPDWLETVIQFIETARRDLQYQAFVAEVDSLIIGSVGCQLFAGLYPHALAATYRKYGYIWGVYVEPSYRCLGLGKRLTSTAVDYLNSIKCTRAILHASPSGKPVYSSLGFSATNEMGLDLV